MVMSQITEKLPTQLDSFLQDVAQGIFGTSKLTYTDIINFADKADSKDLSLLKEYFFNWTSKLTDENEIDINELEAFVLEIANGLFVLHVAQNSNLEVVELLANRVNRNNSLSVIKRNGEIVMTGGFLFENDPRIKELFEKIPNEQHYEFARLLKTAPFKKAYYEEN